MVLRRIKESRNHYDVSYVSLLPMALLRGCAEITECGQIHLGTDMAFLCGFDDTP